MKKFNIQPTNSKSETKIKSKIDYKTKPIGSLGDLEKIAIRISLIQDTLHPVLLKPHVIVFASDHGIANEGVSAFPPEVTYQMVMNFLSGGAAINVFCKQNDIEMLIVDAGVNYDFNSHSAIINSKIAMGTKSFLYGPAMSIKEAEKCIDKGAEIVNRIHANGSNIIGFGEMGIGNTSSASVLMSILCSFPIEDCVGRGTGLEDDGLLRKTKILKQAIINYKKPENPLETLAYFGGFEIAQMCGAMLQAAENKMIILIDGFIASSAFLVASKMCPAITNYVIFCHCSDEAGHSRMLKYLHAKPILNLNLRLGEGTGAALAYPLIQSAVNFMNEMASFESAGVSGKNDSNA